MASPNQQYHRLVNLVKATNSGLDASERTIMVCAYVYSCQNISETNLVNILKACRISLSKSMPHNILHFFYYHKMFNLRDDSLGLVQSLDKMQPKPYYTEANVKFAVNELERIGRARIE